jgi:membrane protein DedA with SNARE-associated domain
MPILGWFMFFTVLDTLIWNSALIGLGYALGSQWTLVERYSRIVEYSVLVVILGLVARFLWGRRKVRG